MKSIGILEELQCMGFIEEACADALFFVKWSNGYYCSHCGCRRYYRIKTRRLPLFECADCQYQSSLTTGTIMEGSRTPLSKWFRAFALFARPEGINAVQLHETIRVTYKTAWLILSKIRHSISAADNATPLTGMIRINDAVYGKPYNDSCYAHPQEHPLLVAESKVVECGQPKINPMPTAPTTNEEPGHSRTPLSMNDKIKHRCVTQTLCASQSINEKIHHLRTNLSKYFKFNFTDVTRTADVEGVQTRIIIKPVSKKEVDGRRVLSTAIRTFADRHIDAGSANISYVIGRFQTHRHRDLIEITKHASNRINKIYRGIGSKYLSNYFDEYCFHYNRRFVSKDIFAQLLDLCATTSGINLRTIIHRKHHMFQTAA